MNSCSIIDSFVVVVDDRRRFDRVDCSNGMKSSVNELFNVRFSISLKHHHSKTKKMKTKKNENTRRVANECVLIVCSSACVYRRKERKTSRKERDQGQIVNDVDDCSLSLSLGRVVRKNRSSANVLSKTEKKKKKKKRTRSNINLSLLVFHRSSEIINKKRKKSIEFHRR